MKTVLAGTSLLVMLAGCRGQTLELGSNDAGEACEAAAALPGTEAGLWDSGASLAPLVGTWTGYTENYSFPSGSDAIVIVFAPATDGSIGGTVTYGQGTPPPPATDPNVGYPPGINWAGGGLEAGPTDPPGHAPWLVEGFAYSVTYPQFDGTRLRVKTVLAQPWSGWCALQVPTGAGYPCGVYGCLPNGSASITNSGADVTLFNPSTGAAMSVDPGKFALCAAGSAPGVCQCSETSCTALDQYDFDSFDMQLSGTTLDGSLSGTGNYPLPAGALGMVNVHFTLSQ